MDNLTWMNGILYEVAFWRATYKHKPTREWLLHKSTLNHELDLHNFDSHAFLDKCIENGDEQPLVLDIGCGMSYYTGNLHNGKPINIHFIDPLAYFYNDILKKEKVKEAPEITFGMMEHLSSFYPQKNVSLAIIQNALDHSADPFRGIIQAINVLKIGGILYLKHYPDEAEKENYRGFHQYNINIENNKLIIWNKDNRINVNDMISDFATVEVSIHEEPTEIIAVIKKKSPVPETFFSLDNDVQKLCQQLLLHTKQTHSFKYLLSYNTRKIFLYTVQYLMRFTGFGTRNRIKKLLRLIRKK